MKKISNTLFAVATIISCTTFTASYAKPSGATLQNFIFCPDTIDCPQDNALFFCKAIGGSQEYWNYPESYPQDSKIIKGVYTYFKSTSSYHDPANLGRGDCLYENLDSGHQKLILVRAKYNSLIEANDDKTNSWIVDSPHHALCDSSNATKCSFTETAAFGIRGGEGQYSFYANGITIRTANAPYPIPIQIITYEAVISACTKECKIDIQRNRRLPSLVGSIIVNTLDNMKILKTIPVEGHSFKIEKPFNTILIR